MEAIAELYDRIHDLTPEELDKLADLLEAEFDRLDGEPTSAENVSAINDIVEKTKAVKAEHEARDQAQAELEAAKQAGREAIAELRGETAGEGDGEESDEDADDETADDGEDDDDAEEDPEAEEVAEETAVTAAGHRGNRRAGVRGMASRQPAPRQSPESRQADNPHRAVLTASNALGALSGQEITDRDEFARALGHKLERMSRNGEEVVVASAAWTYPEERRLVNDDAELNTRKMEALSGLHSRRYDRAALLKGVAPKDAIVASGGICLPGNVDYSVPTFVSADRPIRDGLVSFQANRGALRFVQPPDINGGLAAATGIWTEATDANPGSATKPVVAVSCGSVEEVFVEGIATRLQFGNMMGRFAPEQIAANIDIAMAAAARVAENNLLALIEAQCVSSVTNSMVVGACRDMLTTIEEFVAAFRNAHRLDESITLTAIFPLWLKQVLKVDLQREIGHSQNAYLDSISPTDEYIDGLIKNAGVNPIWHIDGQAAGSGYGNQYYGLQGNGAILPFPNSGSNIVVRWYCFIEGSMQFLDGGRLDLGVVRDSVLDSTNDYETFVELFEGLAYRGFQNGAYAFNTTLNVNGATGGTVAVTATDK